MAAALLALEIYALAIAISMAVAVLIAVIDLVTGATARRVSRTVQVSQAGRERTGQPPPAEHVAAVTAAVYAAMGAHRIVHIEERGRGEAWTAEGLSAHHSSHAPSGQRPRAAPPGRRR